MFIPYEKGVAEKLKKIASKYGCTAVFTKTKDLRGQIRTKQKNKIEFSCSRLYEVDCNNCLKNYTGETGIKLKESMKEHQEDEEKSRKDKKIIGLSQHMKTTSHSPACDDVRIICRENNWKKRQFKEAARTTSYNKEQLMNKSNERNTISNLWSIKR